ncbi:hypothetical protein LJK88_24415 [Paenibacillus sp. P26]|nr:hypothetical protein LJK88_24415 [Paenibacillus sp. P26]UUZ95382.1 hypothetical protein LJK87_13480 [Paenibacillus sp. P25]
MFARKAPYHYGWDWGPRLVTSGIWREVKLEAWSGSRIADLYIRQDQVSATGAVLTAVAEIESDAEGNSRFGCRQTDCWQIRKCGWPKG